MTELLSESRPIARKEHDCMSCEFIINSGWSGDDWTPEEQKEVKAALADKWKIKKGERYVRQSVKQDGEIHTFRAKEAMHKICIKYDFYDG